MTREPLWSIPRVDYMDNQQHKRDEPYYGSDGRASIDKRKPVCLRDEGRECGAASHTCERDHVHEHLKQRQNQHCQQRRVARHSGV